MPANTTFTFMASSRPSTIQVSVICDSLSKRIFSTTFAGTGRLLGIAKRNFGPSDLRCFYDGCSFQCPSMKSMTDHVGKHYDGLRPSVNKKNATSLPIQPSLSAPQFFLTTLYNCLAVICERPPCFGWLSV